MKKVIKFRRILQKSKHIKKCIPKKCFSRKISLKNKNFFEQIKSPHNTNDYLINNRSSPFFIEEEDEEESINIKPSSIILLEDDTNSEINYFTLNDSESTNEESMIFNEKSENGEGLIETCLDGIIK